MNAESKTALLVEEAKKELDKKEFETEILDLRNYSLQFCKGTGIETYNEDMQTIFRKVQEAQAYIFAFPVYNFSFSGVAKNFIDIFSYAMDSKVCALMQNSGGERSFLLGIAELSMILKMHNNIDVINEVVHSSQGDFDGTVLVQEKVKEKLVAMADAMEKKLL